MTQHTIHGLIVYHEGSWIGQQEFEGGYPRGNHIIHRRFRSRGQVGNGDMKAIIDYGLTLCFGAPGLQSFGQRMVPLLVRKIEDSGGTTTGGGNSARLKVIAGNGGGQGKLHMRMDINGTGKDVFTSDIKHYTGLHIGKGTW